MSDLEGKTVRYRASFCRSIGAYCGDIPFMRGVVVSTKMIGRREFAEVKWNEDYQTLVSMDTLEVTNEQETQALST